MNIITSSSVVRPEWDFDQVEISKQRLRKLYFGEKLDRIPLKFIPAGGPEPEPRDIVAIDPLVSFNEQMRVYNHIYKHFPEGDFIPLLSNCELGQGFLPSMYGFEVITDPVQPPYTHERLVKDLEKDIEKIPERINPETDGWGPKLKARIKFFLEAGEEKIPIAVTDYQSPYGIATKLIGNEDLMLAMFDTPELVHELMRRVTQAISDLILAMREWVGKPELFIMNTSIPVPEAGLILWDDYISVISPELHREFCLPYNMQLYEKFGFGHLHTCGPNFPNYINALLAHDGINSIDISSYLGAHSRTREEMLEMRRMTREKSVCIIGSLCASTLGRQDGVVTEPDFEFFKKMADGRLSWCETGTREQGLKYLQWASAVD